MASIVRPALLRRSCLSLPAPRTLPKQASQHSAFSKLSSPTSRRQSIVSRTSSFRSSTLKFTPSSTLRVAGFHASGRRAILPPGPQIIDGTANDPAPIPQPSPTHGSYHWAFERLISAALIPLTVAPFAAGTLNPITDAILCATIIIHSHIGFQSIIIDYIPSKRLPKTRALFWWGLRAGTLVVAVGLYEFETNDVGLTEAIKRIWTA
ncbi:membrane anchor subunit of succinate dehydrogenase, Sdh4 [Mycoblastus sanguinarius]|nr:membrane anchor subunit of succinate dehydrogenase, Sdh4 [Mycoblastus sanguinarius]